MGGDEVLMVFHSAGQDIRDKVKHPVPIKQLIDFQRVAVSRGATESVAFSIDKASEFALINEDGVKTLYKGRHNVIISRGHGNDVNFPFQV
jgi:hypothetical protein